MMYEMNSKRQWHFDEQERIRKQGVRKCNGGQLVKVENMQWGRKKRRVKENIQLKGDLVTGNAKTATS